MSELLSPFAALPSYGRGGLAVLLLYAIQSEIRFGSRARAHRTEASDRNSTWVVSISAAVPVLGFALGMKASSPGGSSWLPHWFSAATVPGLPWWHGSAL